MSDQDQSKASESKPAGQPASLRRRTAASPGGTPAGYTAPRRPDPADPADDPYRHGQRVWPD